MSLFITIIIWLAKVSLYGCIYVVIVGTLQFIIKDAIKFYIHQKEDHFAKLTKVPDQDLIVRKFN